MNIPKCLVGGSLALALTAGSASAQTLKEALSAAYVNNPTLKSEQAALRATDEEVPQVISDFRPTLDLVGKAGVTAVRSNTGTGTDKGQHREPRSLGLALTQPIYNGGQTVAALDEAEYNVMAARLALRKVEQTILFDAVTAFATVFRDQAVLKLNAQNEQVLRRNLTATQDRYDAGGITITNVHQSEARLSGATADRIGSESTLEQSRADYQNLMGDLPGNLVRPQPPTEIPTSKAEAIRLALMNDPDVVEAELTERSKLANVRQVKGELQPSLELTGSAERSFESTSEISRVDTYSALLTLTIPIYGSGLEYSKLREARQQVVEQRQTVQQARRDATQTASRAWDGLRAARSQIVAFEAQIKSANTALAGVKDEANFGTRTILDILDAEQELLDAKVSLARAERDEVVAVYELKQSIGQLTAKQLDLDVDFYNPLKHYEEVRGKWFGGESSGGITREESRYKRQHNVMSGEKTSEKPGIIKTASVVQEQPVAQSAVDQASAFEQVVTEPGQEEPALVQVKTDPVLENEEEPLEIAEATLPKPAANSPTETLAVPEVSPQSVSQANMPAPKFPSPGISKLHNPNDDIIQQLKKIAEAKLAEPAKPSDTPLLPASIRVTAPETAPKITPLGTPKVASVPAPVLSTPVAAVPATGTKFGIQLGAFLTEVRAKSAWRTYSLSAPKILNGLSPKFKIGSLKNGQTKVTKLMVGSFAARVGARNVCEQLKSKRLDCFTVRY